MHFLLVMNPLSLPEIFYQIAINLTDKEKIFLILCSKITYSFKLLLILDSEYNLKEINDKWRVKNIIIKEFSLDDKIKEIIKNLIPNSIRVNSRYVKFISYNTNIKLFHNEEIIKKLISYECGSYLVMELMLNNDKSINNINRQFIIASRLGYLDVVKLLIELGADIHAQCDNAIVWASCGGNLLVVKLLVKLGANIHAQNNQAIIYASCHNHLLVAKLLIKLGANVHAQDSQAIIFTSRDGYLSIVKLLIDSGADVHAQNNLALKYAIRNKHTDVIKLLEDNS